MATSPRSAPPIIVKIGGSLLTWSEFPARLRAYLDTRAAERLVLLAGGGRAADVIRDLHRVHNLDDERSHWLAIRALGLTAHVMADLVPGLTVIDDLAHRHAAWMDGQTPILAPLRFLVQDESTPDALPHSWDVTSDAIAAHLAVRLEAAELTLLKSTSLPPGTDRASAARLGLVDSFFPAASARLQRITFLNLRDPEGSAQVLTVDRGSERSEEA